MIPDPKAVSGKADLAASNGIIHLIDGVLLPLPVANKVKAFLAMKQPMVKKPSRKMRAPKGELKPWRKMRSPHMPKKK